MSLARPRLVSFFTTLYACFAIIWLLFIIYLGLQRSNRLVKVLINNVLILFCTAQLRDSIMECQEGEAH